MQFPINTFWKFCSQLSVATKERGLMTLIPENILGGQRYVIEQINEGLAQDAHEFVILKGRQLGISTISLALDLFFMMKYPGLQGLMITDTDKNRDVFRSNLTQYLNSLPQRYRPSSKNHNRTFLELDHNNSRLVYLVAGLRAQGNLGRGSSGAYLHATECSSWGDEEGYISLMNTLAQINPNRLYIFESTARGFGAFYEHWEIAKDSADKRAIFVGWWRNEFYQKTEETPEYKRYWDGHLSRDEELWVSEVWEQYGYNITPAQIAWWRWYIREQCKGDETMALQEMPPTEDYAFQLSGSKFFNSARINSYYQAASKEEKPKYYEYVMGNNFEDTVIVDSNEEDYQLMVWEEYIPGETYVIGGDPAYGSSEWADEFAICVLRCYSDKLVQVAELGTTDFTTSQFAWVLMHLGSVYQGALVTLEMQGPGTAVHTEMEAVKRLSKYVANKPGADFYAFVNQIKSYFWRKPDSLGSGVALQWQTNNREKLRMMDTVKSLFERGFYVFRSTKLIEQLRNIARDGDSIGGEGRAKDDRVLAAAIATMGWYDNLLEMLEAENKTYSQDLRPPEESGADTALQRSVRNFFERNGLVPE